jgi:voltage-gated potassium channel
MTTSTNTEKPRRASRLRLTLRLLYHGSTPTALRFQLAMLLIDLAIIVFFIATPVLRESETFLWVDYSVAVLLAADITARGMASSNVARWLRQPTVLVDIFILVTLLAPHTLANLGFLRILRLWSISHSGALWRPLRHYGLLQWREVTHSVINLLTFLFLATGFIYTSFFRSDSGIEGYVDAFYFTVATVTTTGFGDIVLPGVWGKLTSIVTMIAGISLFVKLAQSIVRPNKVFFECPNCALQRHDPDAVHCKACGETLKIPDDGS